MAAQPAFRHPWLQLNPLTAFVAAAVVGAFGARSRDRAAAVFLPVLAGQSGNTGCQALRSAARHDLGVFCPVDAAP
jgi:magnesium transporter